MKHKLLYLSLLAFSACTDAPKSDEAKTSEAKEVTTVKSGETWQARSSESKIEWIGTKVSGYHTGEVPLKSGEMYVKDGNVTGGKFILDLSKMVVSGPKGSDAASNKKLQTHLHSADFFDVEKYPEATFELIDIKPFSGNVKDTADPRQNEINEYKVGDPTHTVNGNLTLKGVTKNIEFPARITITGGNSAEAVAKFNIDRQQWGLKYPGKPDDLIRDAIHLGLNIKAMK